jgi:hypothetical protein
MITRDIQGVVRGLSAPTIVAIIACLVLVGSAVAKPSSHPFEIEPGSFHVAPSLGQAAAHADLTVSFDFAHEGENGPTYNDGRTTIVNLPPGFIGNDTAVPRCTVAQLVGNDAIGEPGNPECKPASQVGTISVEVHFAHNEVEEVMVPLYNMEVTSFGVTAELGFNVAGLVIQEIPVSVRPSDLGITATAPNIQQSGEFRKASITVWGLPASHVHDPERGLECYGSFKPPCSGGGESANIPVKPFLANPTSCEAHIATMAAYSWEHPEEVEWSHAQTEVTPITECERVPFDPSIGVDPTTRSAESPSGLNVSLVVPQTWDNSSGIATAHLKDSVLALPVGYTVNPSSGSGLGVCTAQQLEAETSSSPPGAGCPPESKIGTVDVETPVLAEKLTGNIYVAKPFDNPFGTPKHPGGSLLALYVVVKAPARGLVVKLAGKIEPNLVTGQLVTSFENNPQVPFGKVTLKLRQGVTSPLVSPPACGTYTAQADLTPWSAPLSPQHMSSQRFAIEQGIGGGPCPPGGVPPFKPGIVAGTLNNSAGAYSPMIIRITRNDGEQEITRFSSILPPGLTANLTGIPFCPDASIEAVKHVTGAQEEAEPSCPAASEIGHSLVGAGVGSVLAWTSGKVYLAGPYNGAPFSIVAITSAKVGPFDLGTVVVREALDIDPETAVVTVDAKASDPIPHIIEGIVVHVRDIRVYIDRPHFMINPTNCNPLSFAATITGAGADPANPADQMPVTVDNSFQLANCQNLQFKPAFKVSTSGKTSRAKGASLSVKLTYPKAPQGTQTNIAKVKVNLPRQLPSRLTTLQKACPDSVFNANPAACPAGSRVGQARAITPILPVPLTGPAYFVSHGGAKFPELIIVLQGYGVTLDLRSETFISKKGITSSTFRSVPDDPVGSFELTLPQGPDSALAANGNLCKTKLKMPITLTAQNGDVIHRSTPITVISCAKHKAHKINHHRKR